VTAECYHRRGRQTSRARSNSIAAGLAQSSAGSDGSAIALLPRTTSPRLGCVRRRHAGHQRLRRAEPLVPLAGHRPRPAPTEGPRLEGLPSHGRPVAAGVRLSPGRLLPSDLVQPRPNRLDGAVARSRLPGANCSRRGCRWSSGDSIHN
jgi:hypothetical protein